MATLTVVMLVFFVMAMVAAYTNRNLVFEQRTSANSYRAAQALAAAEAGVDWSVAMLNGGTIDTSCLPVAGGSDDFRTRYLKLQYDGTFTYSKWPSGLTQATPAPSCVMNNAGATCSCPNAATTTLPLETGEAPVVFRVKLELTPSKDTPTAYPGTLGLTVRGCTSALAGDVNAGNVNSNQACHKAAAAGNAVVDSQSAIGITLGLLSALPVPPVAPLTAGGTIDVAAGATLRASNPDGDTGAALHAGGAISGAGSRQVYGPAGSTAALELGGDNKLFMLSASTDAYFQALFGMMPTDYQQQPAAVRTTCGGTCTASGTLATLASANPTRVLWINGNLDFDNTATFGSATLPVVVVVTGNVTVSAPMTLYGVVYSGGSITWSATGGTVVGAMVAKDNFAGSGGSVATLAYDADLMRRIRNSYGSFVRVPGSWRILTLGG